MINIYLGYLIFYILKVFKKKHLEELFLFSCGTPPKALQQLS